MFEGSRLSYVVPGYTGHIPKVVKFDPVQSEEKPSRYQIPGYAGYIPAIKSENIFGKTYGKITYNISSGEFHQGQDVNRETRYTSHAQDTFVNQRQVLQRTAAEIVGVQPKKEQYVLDASKVTQSQFQPSSGFGGNDNRQQGEEAGQTNGAANFYGVESSEPLRLGTPLPGYTGVNKRVTAANIFGQTYANARRTALQDQKNINFERTQNFFSQASQVPPVRR